MAHLLYYAVDIIITHPLIVYHVIAALLRWHIVHISAKTDQMTKLLNI